MSKSRLISTLTHYFNAILKGRVDYEYHQLFKREW